MDRLLSKTDYISELYHLHLYSPSGLLKGNTLIRAICHNCPTVIGTKPVNAAITTKVVWCSLIGLSLSMPNGTLRMRKRQAPVANLRREQ